ncbi:MAG: hypothetical protein IPO08_20980 [Xanthomonadales bacterium]|nr:hypothetical protein [Xanthomonadales bacterium]
MRLFQLLAGLMPLMLCGCGVMLRGSMDRLEDGAALPFAIQTSYGTGSMEATDPATGEVFTGQYTGITQGGGSSFGTIYNAQMMQTSTVQTFSRPTHATARGTLRGNMGTVVQVALDIKPGLRPSGHGEGMDNKGRHYQVRF